MAKIQLYLSNHERFRLEKFVFEAPRVKKPLVTIRHRTSVYRHDDEQKSFTWTAAVRALAILSIKTAHAGANVSISSEGRGPAASLDYAIAKEPAWLLDFFGQERDGRTRAKYIFIRKNSEQRSQGPVEVSFDPFHVKPSQIAVFIDDREITAKSELEAIYIDLERQSAEGPDAQVKRQKYGATENNKVRARSFSARLTVDPEQGRHTVSCALELESTTGKPVEHFNWLIPRPEGVEATNFQIRSDRTPLSFVRMRKTQQLDTYLVRVPEPVDSKQPLRSEFSHDFEGQTNLSGGFEYPLIGQTERLTLEVACIPGYEIARAAVIATNAGDTLFGELPEVEIKQEDDTQIAHWTMINPPQEFQFRLYWTVAKIEKAAGKPDRTDSRKTISFPNIVGSS